MDIDFAVAGRLWPDERGRPEAPSVVGETRLPYAGQGFELSTWRKLFVRRRMSGFGFG